MIEILLLVGGALTLVGGVVASLRERKTAWRAFGLGLALFAAAFGMSLLPRLVAPIRGNAG
jgi:hypothetical protein